MIKRQRYLFSPDWFGLGCLIYEMIEGHSPFRKIKDKAKRTEIEHRILETQETYSSKFSAKVMQLCTDVIILTIDYRFTLVLVRNIVFSNFLYTNKKDLNFFKTYSVILIIKNKSKNNIGPLIKLFVVLTPQIDLFCEFLNQSVFILFVWQIYHTKDGLTLKMRNIK